MFPVVQGIRQIERWLIAAAQDKHPAIKLLHANYAVGNLDMIRQMYSDEEIRQYTGKDAQQLMSIATRLQDEAQQRLVAICPEAEPKY
ncbi:MAG: hypothetical protein QXT45_06305 [Candidatus Bilamarchaeaceae archaeon]